MKVSLTLIFDIRLPYGMKLCPVTAPVFSTGSVSTDDSIISERCQCLHSQSHAACCKHLSATVQTSPLQIIRAQLCIKGEKWVEFDGSSGGVLLLPVPSGQQFSFLCSNIYDFWWGFTGISFLRCTRQRTFNLWWCSDIHIQPWMYIHFHRNSFHPFNGDRVLLPWSWTHNLRIQSPLL